MARLRTPRHDHACGGDWAARPSARIAGTKAENQSQLWKLISDNVDFMIFDTNTIQ